MKIEINHKMAVQSSQLREMLVRILMFIIYFIIAGLSGKLITLFVRPILSFFTKNNPDLESIILYFFAVVVMFAALSFFSFRDGCNDAEFLKFSLARNILSYIAAALIFGLLCGLVKIYYMPSGENILEFFMFSYFPPSAITDFMMYTPIIGDIFSAANYIYISEDILCFILIMLIGLAATAASYRLARFIWITGIKKIDKKSDEIESELNKINNNFFEAIAKYSSDDGKNKDKPKIIRQKKSNKRSKQDKDKIEVKSKKLNKYI